MTKLTAEELKGYTKEDMIALVMQMQEALAVSNAKQFGRKSETMECLGQVSLFNETEMYADASVPEATAKKRHPALPYGAGVCAQRPCHLPRQHGELDDLFHGALFQPHV